MRTSQKIIIIAIIIVLIAIIALLFTDYSKYWGFTVILGFIGAGLISLYRYRRRKKRKLTYIFKLLNKYIPNTKHIHEYKEDHFDIGIPINQIDLHHQLKNIDNINLDQETIDIILQPSNEDDDVALGSHTTMYKDDPKLKDMILSMIQNINKDKENNINDKLFLINLFLIGNDIKLDENKQKVFDRMNLFKCRREIKAQFLTIKHSEIPLFGKKNLPDLIHLIWLQKMYHHLDALAKKDPNYPDLYLIEEFDKKIDDREHIFKKFDFDKLSHETKMVFKEAMEMPGFHEAIEIMDVLNSDTYTYMHERLLLYVNKIYLCNVFESSYKLYDSYFKANSNANMYDIQFMDSFNELINKDVFFKLPTDPYAISDEILNSIINLGESMDEEDEILLRKSKSIDNFINTIKKTYFGEFLSFHKFYRDIMNYPIDSWVKDMLTEIRYKYYSYDPKQIDRSLEIFLEKNNTVSDYTKKQLEPAHTLFTHMYYNTDSYQLKQVIGNILLR